MPEPEPIRQAGRFLVQRVQSNSQLPVPVETGAIPSTQVNPNPGDAASAGRQPAEPGGSHAQHASAVAGDAAAAAARTAGDEGSAASTQMLAAGKTGRFTIRTQPPPDEAEDPAAPTTAPTAAPSVAVVPAEPAEPAAAPQVGEAEVAERTVPCRGRFTISPVAPMSPEQEHGPATSTPVPAAAATGRSTSAPPAAAALRPTGVPAAPAPTGPVRGRPGAVRFDPRPDKGSTLPERAGAGADGFGTASVRFAPAEAVDPNPKPASVALAEFGYDRFDIPADLAPLVDAMMRQKVAAGAAAVLSIDALRHLAQPNFFDKGILIRFKRLMNTGKPGPWYRSAKQYAAGRKWSADTGNGGAQWSCDTSDGVCSTGVLDDGPDAEIELPVLYPGGRRESACSMKAHRAHGIGLTECVRFILNLNFSIWLSICFALVFTWICLEYKLFWNAQVAMLIAPIVFPLAFSINESYRRREKVLDDFSAFFGAASELFWLHRDWERPAQIQDWAPAHATNVRDHVRALLETLVGYIAEPLDSEARSQRLGAMYRLFSRLALANDAIRQSQLHANSPLCTRLIHYHNLMITAFERIRTVREYRTPRTVRSFCKIVVFMLPSLLAPWFAFSASKGAMDVHPFDKRDAQPVVFDQDWSAYYAAVICGLIFGSMQSVQDTLDDPFDGISEDDINIPSVSAWQGTALWSKPDNQKIRFQRDRKFVLDAVLRHRAGRLQTAHSIDQTYLTPSTSSTRSGPSSDLEGMFKPLRNDSLFELPAAATDYSPSGRESSI